MNKVYVFVLLFSVLTLASFSHVSADTDQRYGGTFIVGAGSDPENLNPAITESVYTLQVGALVFNNLLRYDSNFVPYSDLAQSWNVSPDGLTYTFKLVRNATFHDGHPLTSTDVKFTYTQVLAKYRARMIAPMSNVASVDAPDAYTIVFRMSKPYSPLISLLDSVLGAVLPAHLYNGTDILANKNNFAPIGSGPYKFAEWKRNEYVKVVRNEKYFKAGQPYLDQVIFKVIPDANSRVLALQKGDINFLVGSILPLASVPQLQKDPNLKYTFQNVYSSGDVAQLQLNLRNRYLNNSDVRHALSLGLDRQELIDKILFGLGKPAKGPIPSTYGSSIFNSNLPTYNNDVAKANDLLDKAGFPKGADGIRFTLEMLMVVSFGDLVRAAELMKSQWARIGVNLKVSPTERGALLDAVYTRWQFDMYLSSMATGPVPDVGVARFSLTSNISHNTFSNAAGYSNSQVDSLWQQAATAVDPVKRTQALYRVQEILVQDMPHLWLWELYVVAVWSKDFAGICTPLANSGSDTLQDTFWLKGSLVSPGSALLAITNAQSKIVGLQGQGYNVTAARSLLSQAQAAYDSGNYAAAQSLAGDALNAPVAPFPWALVVGLVAVIVLTGAAAGFIIMRRRKREEQEDTKAN